MATSVSDARSNANDQIVHAAQTIKNNIARRAVFECVSRGKKRVKSVSEIVTATGLARKTVTTQARVLVNNHIVQQTTKDGEIGYEKDPFYSQHRDRILKLAGNPRELEKVPTKVRPKVGVAMTTITVPAKRVRARRISVDDLDSFLNVRKVPQGASYTEMPEDTFKAGLARILGERGEFKDWGGEKADLISTNLLYRGRRLAAALALKGPGKKRKKLVPGDLGANGDQIQRMFTASADAFIVQYWQQIDDSVVVQLEMFARLKSVLEGRDVFFGVIDGSDSTRLIKAYAEEFGLNGSR